MHWRFALNRQTHHPQRSEHTLHSDCRILQRCPHLKAMIVENSQAGEVTEGHAKMPTELPPAYATSSSTHQSPSASQYSQPPSLPRQNNLHIKRTAGPLKGTWIINPNLKLPEAVLTPLRWPEKRKNLQLVSESGAINAEVWIVGKERSGEAASGVDRDKNVWPATVNVMGKNGAVKVRMNGDENHPFELTVKSHCGKVTIGLPRTFVGPLTVATVAGPLCLVGSVKAQVATFSEVKNTFKGFIGDLELSGFGNGDWEGSSLDVDCQDGSVNIYYLDELDKRKAAKMYQPHFWARMFRKDTQPSPNVMSVQ
ncbi:hypothetical protein BD410DRAFT_93121 [Rickenella mellea]|uniref:DUF7330 domain-containing protein n=1 Tax=Rickenella mellea TaxID=50990 RepID=A0A4Y7QA46_9AGAM|nr:hypothetical protein BD410DRAFT_93121 [Rickenella mellea]